MPVLRVKKLHPAARPPQRTRPDDAALDLFADSSGFVAAGATAMIGTGVAIEIPPGYAGVIKDRSGLASQGVTVRGGVIDSNYRGEVKVLVRVESDEGWPHFVGDRIAQMLIVPVPTVWVEEVAELSPSDRGAAGFGSTGA